MQSYDTLHNFYTMNFNLWKHHGWAQPVLETMMPFEREIYVTLLQNYLKDEHHRLEREKMDRQARGM